MASATGRRHLKEKTGRKGRVNGGEEEEEGRRRKVPLKNEKRKRASGASRMPDEGSGRTATTVRRLRVASLLSCFFLPARFDWSIMGCTILLLALMNLEEQKQKERERDKKKQTLNHSCFFQNDSSPAGNSRDKTFFFVFFLLPGGNISRRELPERRPQQNPHKQKGNCAPTWEPSEGYF